MTTKIEWTDATWNPVTGCTKVSPGCKHCYAERLAKRFKNEPFAEVRLHPERLQQPTHWRKPRQIFVCSMSDLFHPDVPDEYIAEVFGVMAGNPRHIFQVLTKRAGRLAEFAGRRSTPWPRHIWAGVSVENEFYAPRLALLRHVPAPIRFVSAEPLLGPLDLTRHLTWLSWVIVGGESGPRARTMRPEWAKALRDQCVAAKVPFFFKQWGGTQRIAGAWGGRVLDGRCWDEKPESNDAA